MALLNFFFLREKNTADIAKERLKIVIAEQRFKNTDINEPCYLSQLRKDILEVICKYANIKPKMVKVSLNKKDNYISILEINITISESK